MDMSTKLYTICTFPVENRLPFEKLADSHDVENLLFAERSYANKS